MKETKGTQRNMPFLTVKLIKISIKIYQKKLKQAIRHNVVQKNIEKFRINSEIYHEIDLTKDKIKIAQINDRD